MALGTPFIDTLTSSQRATVAAKSRGPKRPSYYDGTLAQDNARLMATGSQPTSDDANVQISEDLEAAFILMSTADKNGLLEFIGSAIKVATSLSDDDFLLLVETVAVRKAGYVQISADVGSKTTQYDVVRSNVLGFIQNIANQAIVAQNTADMTGRPDPTSVVVPDLGALFSALQDGYVTLARPDILAVHDRITDTVTLNDYQNAATHRTKELSSWAKVVTLYLI